MAGELEVAPDVAFAAWTDPERWAGFVEGFERVVDLDARWPALGASVVWESVPDGRGRVTERVAEREPGRRLVTEVSERSPGGGAPRLTGRQSLELSPVEPSAARAELRLDYEIVPGRGSPGPVTDFLFVRRALRDALRRTLERFAAETARETAR